MTKRKSVDFVILTLSVLMQSVSILHYYFATGEKYVFNWRAQFIVVAGLSIILTVLQYLSPGKKVSGFSFTVRFVALLIIYIPTVLYVNLKQLFLLAFLLDMVYLIATPVNIILATLSFLTIFVSSILNQKLTGLNQFPHPDKVTYLLVYTLISITIFFIFKLFLDRSIKVFNQMSQMNKTINKLTDANSGFQNYIQIIEKKSSEDERNRIIREIHDSIGYTLTTIIMQSTSVLESGNSRLDKSIVEIFSNINSYAREGLKDMRIVLRLLKDKKERKLSDIEEIRKMINAFEKATNISVRLELGNIPMNFDPSVSHVIFRLIQEGMINALRHGMASIIEIAFFKGENSIVITITDNGKGFRSISPGIGLKGIHERLEKVNGRYSISSSTRGTTLRITIPQE